MSAYGSAPDEETASVCGALELELRIARAGGTPGKRDPVEQRARAIERPSPRSALQSACRGMRNTGERPIFRLGVLHMLEGRSTAKAFALALKDRFLADKVMDVAASVTFFGVLALFPFLLFLVTLAGLVLHPHQVEQFIQEVSKVAPEDATRIIAQQIRDIQRSHSVGLLTVGFVGALWSASGGVVSLMDGFNAVHHVDESRPFWKTRAVAILTTIAGGAVMLIAALVAVAVGPIARAIGGPVAIAVAWLRLPVAALLMAMLWAVLYHVLPDVKQRFRFLSPGSVIAVAGWLASSWGFSFYVAHFGDYNKTYGAIGGAIIMLLWMWISAMFLLVGPLINRITQELQGARTRSPGDAGRVAPALSPRSA